MGPLLVPNCHDPTNFSLWSPTLSRVPLLYRSWYWKVLSEPSLLQFQWKDASSFSSCQICWQLQQVRSWTHHQHLSLYSSHRIHYFSCASVSWLSLDQYTHHCLRLFLCDRNVLPLLWPFLTALREISRFGAFLNHLLAFCVRWLLLSKLFPQSCDPLLSGNLVVKIRQ